MLLSYLDEDASSPDPKITSRLDGLIKCMILRITPDRTYLDTFDELFYDQNLGIVEVILDFYVQRYP